MNFSSILIAAALIGGMGLVFGALLGVLNRFFAVKEDPRKAEIRALLPGANCGGCGFSGCDAYAQAILEGKAKPDLCPVSGPETSEALGRIMGVTVEKKDHKIATVRCRGDIHTCSIRFHYDGPKTCKAANLAAMGDKACQYSCLGYGDCESVCPFDAIHVSKDRLAQVDPDKCQGCGVCLSACPRNVLQLMTAKHNVHSTCSAMERGKVVRESCTAGCIGCGLCEKSCKFGALKMNDNLPEIDQNLCTGCMQCADNCPTGALSATKSLRRHAVIHYLDCVGCEACKSACQFDAILGVPGEHHSIIEWNCVGCGKCEEACPVHCIEMCKGNIYKKRRG